MALHQLIAELEKRRDQLDVAIRAIEGLDKRGGKSSTARKTLRGKRVMSAEARERIAAAQRLRWAKHRKQARANA
jgi:hypothetical protein